MYAAGLVVREIADRCQQNVVTVSLHLRVPEKHFPRLRARQQVALASLGTDCPKTLSRDRLQEEFEFHTNHHRLPRTNRNETWRSLARWIAIEEVSGSRLRRLGFSRLVSVGFLQCLLEQFQVNSSVFGSEGASLLQLLIVDGLHQLFVVG